MTSDKYPFVKEVVPVKKVKKEFPYYDNKREVTIPPIISLSFLYELEKVVIEKRPDDYCSYRVMEILKKTELPHSLISTWHILYLINYLGSEYEMKIYVDEKFITIKRIPKWDDWFTFNRRWNKFKVKIQRIWRAVCEK